MTSRLIMAVATNPGQDEGRLRHLVAGLEYPVQFLPFDRLHKAASALKLLRRINKHRPDLIVMEGTGLAGGSVLVLAQILWGSRYVVSSGDAIGPYLGGRRKWLAPVGWAYEVALMRHCAAFVGWTPYLVGRALTLGAPTGATAEGWAPYVGSKRARPRIRSLLNIPDDAIVFGLVGSLNWNSRVEYSYGLELIQALLKTDRDDICVVVVGDGSGLSRLRNRAGSENGNRVKLIGRVPPELVPDYLAALDVASLPQTVNQIGSFRYTTKLSEYLDAGLPVVTGRLPVSYDLLLGKSWRLPGSLPWSQTYVDAMAQLMRSVTHDEIQSRRPSPGSGIPSVFSLKPQQDRVAALLQDIVGS